MHKQIVNIYLMFEILTVRSALVHFNIWHNNANTFDQMYMFLSTVLYNFNQQYNKSTNEVLKTTIKENIIISLKTI